MIKEYEKQRKVIYNRRDYRYNSYFILKKK